jgi:hypothetical protein
MTRAEEIRQLCDEANAYFLAGNIEEYYKRLQAASVLEQSRGDAMSGKFFVLLGRLPLHKIKADQG